MIRSSILLLLTVLLYPGCVSTGLPMATDRLEADVADRERAFAATMERRDFAAFSTFIASDAVFLTGAEPLRGAEAVKAYWARFFEAEQAPFAWKPERVMVSGGGRLALSSGPVWNAEGRGLGVFTSVWRLDDDGTWRVVLDKGGCRCPEE